MTKDTPIDEAYRAGASIQTLATLHGCSLSCIYRRLGRAGVRIALGLPASLKATWVDEYAKGRSTRQIAAAFGVDKSTVADYLVKQGAVVKSVGAYRTHKVNERFFEKIETEAQAYWLGFFEADGSAYRTQTGCVLSIGLANVDRGHLVKWKQAIESDAPITQSQRNLSRVVIGSKKLYHDVWARMNAIDVPKHLLQHYFRGVFDGDGCLFYNTRTKQWGFDQLADFDVLTKLKAWLYKHTGRLGGKIEWRKGIDRMQYIGNRQVPVIMALLYTGATVFLDRKATKWAEMNRQLSIDTNQNCIHSETRRSAQHV